MCVIYNFPDGAIISGNKEDLKNPVPTADDLMDEQEFLFNKINEMINTIYNNAKANASNPFANAVKSYIEKEIGA